MANVTNPAKPNKGDEMFQNRLGGQSSSDKSQGGSIVDTAKDMASSAASTVSSAAGSAVQSVKGAAENAATYVGQKAGDATHAAGSGLRQAGEAIRSAAPQQDMLKGLACSVADGLDSAGRYLEEEGLSGMAEDMTTLIRKNPIPALMVGVGIGFLLGRVMAPSRNNY